MSCGRRSGSVGRGGGRRRSGGGCSGNYRSSSVGRSVVTARSSSVERPIVTARRARSSSVERPVVTARKARSSSVKRPRQRTAPVIQNSKWIVGEKIGQGGFGAIFIACYYDNCEYVMKVQKANFQFENEVNILIKLNNAKPKIAPHIFDYWVSGDFGVIILERMDRDMKAVLLTAPYKRQILRLLHNLHKHRIAMIDILKGNVLQKGSQLFLCDFGISVDFSGVPDTEKIDVYGEMNPVTWTEAKKLDLKTFLFSKCKDCFRAAMIL